MRGSSRVKLFERQVSNPYSSVVLLELVHKRMIACEPKQSCSEGKKDELESFRLPKNKPHRMVKVRAYGQACAPKTAMVVMAVRG
jgi:hypothetical protein